ncbi:hypothetical protein EVAR_64193_1 [Eumeta japonica]|uniref:Uncharacterized protein n=1 Tax=Eumeta variegata TaxID=151549 RepID=A0A4C1ZJI6_EUMVA|nr:hypothetical protein EVAR_64193_1 [Eumeta japonica]
MRVHAAHAPARLPSAGGPLWCRHFAQFPQRTLKLGSEIPVLFRFPLKSSSCHYRSPLRTTSTPPPAPDTREVHSATITTYVWSYFRPYNRARDRKRRAARPKTRPATRTYDTTEYAEKNSRPEEKKPIIGGGSESARLNAMNICLPRGGRVKSSTAAISKNDSCNFLDLRSFFCCRLSTIDVCAP